MDLRDAVSADHAAASAAEIEDAAKKEGSPIGAEIAVAKGTTKAWKSFAHEQNEQAFQQISTAADIQGRAGQAEVDIPAREMYADMLLLDDRRLKRLCNIEQC